MPIVFSINGVRIIPTTQKCIYIFRERWFLLGEQGFIFMECFFVVSIPGGGKKEKGKANMCLLPVCLRLRSSGW